MIIRSKLYIQSNLQQFKNILWGHSYPHKGRVCYLDQNCLNVAWVSPISLRNNIISFKVKLQQL